MSVVVQLVANALSKAGVWYYIGGSVASSAYGVARSTLDIDMVSSLDLNGMNIFVKELKNDFYLNEQIIRDAITRRAFFNIIHLHSSIKIDIFISKQRPYDMIAAERRRRDSLGEDVGLPSFYLASAEDVILAKLEWYKLGNCISQKQWGDILGVLRVQRATIDTVYLKKWASKLEVDDLLAKALFEIISNPLKALSDGFMRFSKQTTNSPMYNQLSQYIAHDEDLLQITTAAPASQPTPNLFFASIHYLLLKDFTHDLREFYPSCGGHFSDIAEIWPRFRAFALQHQHLIRELLSNRFVQTNEVRRCGAIRLGIEYLAKCCPVSTKISLLEVGASAGLNLLFDQYPISYYRANPNPHSDFQIDVELKGNYSPSSPAANLQIGHRIGIDLNPLDIRNSDDEMWLKALVWPDQLERFVLLSSAISLAKTQELCLHKGTSLNFDLLESIVTRIKAEGVICLLHSFTLNQFSPTEREEFETICKNLSHQATIWRLAFEWVGEETPELELFSYVSGSLDSYQKLARAHEHGRWVEWLVQN